MRILENAKVVMCLSYSFKIMLNYISCIYLLELQGKIDLCHI